MSFNVRSFKPSFIAVTLWLTLGYSGLANAQQDDSLSSVKTEPKPLTALSNKHLNKKLLAKKELEEKLYRQALFFYFDGNYAAALRQVSVNRQRANVQDAKTNLFEAGLQVTTGLHQQATQTLLNLQNQSQVIKKQSENKSSTSPQELRLIALLQLAEQHIQQGLMADAQQTLGQITSVPKSYFAQYKTLNQLAYWPAEPLLIATQTEQDYSSENIQKKADANASLSQAYIELNQALLHMQNQQFDRAKPILMNIKDTQWSSFFSGFWQSLFNPFSDDDTKQPDEIQQQAIQDYAQLLLAQLYVQQEDYQAAYNELEQFPQDSPYTESALYLFAYAANKSGQFDTAIQLFDLMQQQYPYSHLGWQAQLLLASQITEHDSLQAGLASYQLAENRFLAQLDNLKAFEAEFISTADPLVFYPAKQKNKQEDNAETKDTFIPLVAKQSFSTSSIWLKKALLEPELQGHYHTLQELDLMNQHLVAQQQKSDWFKQTLQLNQQRRSLIVNQQQTPYQQLIADLRNKQQALAQLIERAEAADNSLIFATKEEQQWLDKIAADKQIIDSIKSARNVDEYQQRLARVEGVLTWKLQKDLPKRLWQHKTLLNEVKHQLELVESQRLRFTALSQGQSDLTDFTARQQASEADIGKLTIKVTDLRFATHKQIKSNVQDFIEHQRLTLGQMILTTRHQMAAILEQLESMDKQNDLSNSKDNPAKTLGRQSVQSNETSIEGNL